MKTRSNMPLYVVECEDVKALSNSQIDLLRCGDYLVKKDASGEHAYKVTFKSDTGMCITYHDAYCVETQSYDKVGDNWVYNSEDKTIIAEPSFENIVDKDGHKRFIEGDITYNTLPEGMSLTFGKWSLSGTHLLIVVCMSAEDTAVITNGGYVYFNMPQWIEDKIFILFGATDVLKYGVQWYADNGTQQGMTTYLEKGVYSQPDGHDYHFRLYLTALTFTADRKCRIQYDLLIDNE